MKKSKKAGKSSSSKTTKAKKSVVSLVKKTAKKLLVKMSAKAKKPQVKVPAKAAKPAKAPVKAPAKAPVKVNAKAVKPAAKPAKVAAPAPAPVKGKATKAVEPAKKNVKGAPAPVVAAVLTKGAGKAAKTPKVSVSTGHMCREASCENVATTKGYCRLDYIKNWKKIKRKEMILKEGKLNQYIEELVSKYPDKYIDIIRQDLSTELNFNKVIHDLELDESIDDLDYDGDSIDALIGGIKKDIEDFGDEEF